MKRICSLCGIEKDLEEFYRSSKEKHGREYRCKKCSSKKCKKYFDDKRESNPEAWKELQKNIHKKRLEKDPKYYLKSYQKYKKSHSYNRKSIVEWWKKRKARSVIANGIALGKIKKPEFCELCRKIGIMLEAHHDNYDKPNEVIWVCKKCHIDADRKRSEKEAICRV